MCCISELPLRYQKILIPLVREYAGLKLLGVSNKYLFQCNLTSLFVFADTKEGHMFWFVIYYRNKLEVIKYLNNYYKDLNIGSITIKNKSYTYFINSENKIIFTE